MSEERHGSGFVNGFVLGLLVGASVVFLLGTSKGKKVLQMLLDQVEENTAISELLEMPEDEDEYVGIEEEEEQPEEKLSKSKPAQEKSPRAVAKVKRFFKTASKKMVS